MTAPSLYPVRKDLGERNALSIPDRIDELSELIMETIGDVFEVASVTSATYDS
jgi:hypothetical protein